MYFEVGINFSENFPDGEWEDAQWYDTNTGTFGACQYGSGMRNCSSARNECQNSPPVATIVSCLSRQGIGWSSTYQGGHHACSCHFGGRNCTDGSHAIDIGFRYLGNRTPSAMISVIQGCGVPVSCRCEPDGGTWVDYACTRPGATHLHCNVATASCGCN